MSVNYTKFQLQIDDENTKIKFYQDEEDLYITNFDQKQDILNCPIDALLIFDKRFEVSRSTFFVIHQFSDLYISNYVMWNNLSTSRPNLGVFHGKRPRGKDGATIQGFTSALLTKTNSFQKSKMSKTTEDDQYYNYDDSEELGVRTSSDDEIPTNSPHVSAPSSPHRSESLFSTVSKSFTSIPPPEEEIIHDTTTKHGRKRSSPKIKTSGLDLKIQRSLEISR